VKIETFVLTSHLISVNPQWPKQRLTIFPGLAMIRREMSLTTTLMLIHVCIEYIKWIHNEEGCVLLYVHVFDLENYWTDYEDYGLLVCNTMYFSENLTFWRNVQSVSLVKYIICGFLLIFSEAIHHTRICMFDIKYSSFQDLKIYLDHPLYCVPYT
jgi:hypothetical protein